MIDLGIGGVWEEHRGITCVRAPMCPYCDKPLTPLILIPDGRATCPLCQMKFLWRMVATPLGEAYQAWQLPGPNRQPEQPPGERP